MLNAAGATTEDEATEYITSNPTSPLYIDVDESVEFDNKDIAELMKSFSNNEMEENDDQPGSNGEESEGTRENESGEGDTRNTLELSQYTIRPQPFIDAPDDTEVSKITPSAFVADNIIGDGQRQLILDFAMQLHNGGKTYEIHGDRFNTKAEHFDAMGKEMKKVMSAVESRSMEIAETHIDEDSPVYQSEFVRVKDLICIARDFVFTPPDSEPQPWHMDSDKGTVNVIIPLNLAEGHGTEFRPLSKASHDDHPLQHLHDYLTNPDLAPKLGRYYPKDWNDNKVKKGYYFKADMKLGSALLFKGNQVHRGSKSITEGESTSEVRVSLYLAIANPTTQSKTSTRYRTEHSYELAREKTK